MLFCYEIFTVKRFFKIVDVASHIILITFVVIIVTLAAATSLLRHFSPSINEFRKPLLEKINQNNAKLYIDATKIESKWDLFEPELTLYGVTVRSGNEMDDLHLEKLDIRINLVKSLIHQNIYFDYFGISDLDLNLIEGDDGQWTFANIKNTNNENANLIKALKRFWQIDEIVLNNIHLVLTPKNGKAIPMPLLNATLLSSLTRKQFIVEFVTEDKPVINAIINTRHNPSDDNFSANAYLRINQFSINKAMQAFLPESSQLTGVVDSEIWLSWAFNQLHVSGQLTAKNIVYAKDDNQWALTKANTKFYADYADKKWNAGFNGTHFSRDTEDFAIAPIVINKDETLQLRLKSLDLQSTYQFLHHIHLPEKLAAILDALSPNGQLKNISVQLFKDKSPQLTAELNDVSVSAWNGAPELKGVTGYVEANKEGGFVDFDSQSFSLFFPRLFLSPMLFDHGKGHIAWHVGTDTIKVNGKHLKLDAVSGKAVGEFSFILPKVKTEHSFPVLSLAIGVKGSAAEYRNIFIPFTISPHVIKWLDDNVHSGDLPEVGFIFHGPVTKEVVVEKKTVQLWLNVKNAELTYAKDWPAIKQLSGEFLLDDGYGYAYAKNAETKNITISSSEFRLTPENHQTKIEVTAKASTSAKLAKEFLDTPILSQQLNHVIDNWLMPKGSVSSDLAIIATTNDTKTSVDITINNRIENASLVIPDYNIALEKIQGEINFSSNEGLSSTDIKGEFLDKPFSAKVNSTKKNEKFTTTIDVATQINASRFALWSNQPLVNFLTGDTALAAQIYFGGGDAGMNFNSNLKGISVNLPTPFKKSASQERELAVHIPLIAGEKMITIQYGEGIESTLRWDKKGLDAGIISLGLNKTELEKGKIILSGQVRDVKTDQWLEVINRYNSLQNNDKPTEKPNNTIIFAVKNLRIKTLEAYNQTLDAVSLDVFNAYTYWQLALNHKDLKATLKVYNDNQPMDLHVHSVDLEFLSKKQAESGIGLSSNNLSKFPDINVVIDHLISNGDELGEWQFNLRSYDDRMALEQIRASFKGLRLTSYQGEDANLYWTLGSNPKTYFKGGFASDNIANVLKAWGYKQEVHSKTANFMVDSWWEGVPTNFSFNNVNATCQIKLEDGNFADVGAGKSDALKFIGVFNIANLIKRLQLDFSDLTSKGLAYNTVEGTITSNDGVYHFDKPIIVKTPTSKIRFYGDVNMKTEQMNVTMGITLPLASNLPWIVALAAGLPTAAGVYLISKVLDKQVDQLSSAVYQVTGSFAEPEIKFDSLFDTEDGYEKQQKKNLKN